MRIRSVAKVLEKISLQVKHKRTMSTQQMQGATFVLEEFMKEYGLKKCQYCGRCFKSLGQHIKIHYNL